MRRLSAATPLITRSAYCGLHGQAKFGLLSLFRRERRHGDTQEPNASGDGKERFEQSVAELFELASRPDRQLTPLGDKARCIPLVFPNRSSTIRAAALGKLLARALFSA